MDGVQLQSHDSRISKDTIRVRLADLDSPEMKMLQGPPAKDYATKWLQSAVVSLDLDDKTGKDPYGPVGSRVYLHKPGTLENFAGRGWPGVRLGFQQPKSVLKKPF